MKRILVAAVMVAGSLAAVGCNKTESGGATTKDSKNTFHLSGPDMATSIKPTEKKIVKIGIKPDADFKDGVNLKIEDKSKGLKADLDKTTVEAGVTEVNLTIEAEADATLGDGMVKIVGTPKSGGSATSPLVVKVDVKKP